MRDGIVFYRSFYEAIRRLPDAELARCFKAIMEYGLNGNEPEAAGIEWAIYCLAKPQIDANNKRYQNGAKGGRPKTEEEPNGNQEETKQEPNSNQEETKQEPNHNQTRTKYEPKEKDKDKVKDKEKDKEKDKDKDKNNNKKSACFVPPTLGDVKEYCKEKGYEIDAERFIDFYMSKDWMIGKNRMKDWRAAVRNWDRNRRQGMTTKGDQRQGMTTKGKNRFHNLEEHGYDYDKMVWGMIKQDGSGTG